MFPHDAELSRVGLPLCKNTRLVWHLFPVIQKRSGDAANVGAKMRLTWVQSI